MGLIIIINYYNFMSCGFVLLVIKETRTMEMRLGALVALDKISFLLGNFTGL